MLTNADRTDREILLACRTVEDPKGIITSAALADYIGVSARNGRSPAGRVSSRLSWMARYGLLERLDPKLWGFKSNEAIWKITGFGNDVLKSTTLPQSMLSQIHDGGRGRRLTMLQELARVSLHSVERDILRRQWQHDLTNSR